MNRRGFLKVLGIGTSITALEPKKLLVLFPAEAVPLVQTPIPITTALSSAPCIVNYASLTMILKELYADRMQDLVYYDNPFLKLVPKESKTTQNYPIPIIYGLNRTK